MPHKRDEGGDEVERTFALTETMAGSVTGEGFK
jgi:hypothetical protein